MELLGTTSEESITASPQTVLHNTIDRSSSDSPSTWEKLVAGAVESASALTLQQPDVSSSEELLDTTSSESTASPRPVPHNTIDSSPLSASSLGSKIYVRRPPNWYQVYFIRMDCSGSFRVYPDLGGSFESLDEAEGAINHHLEELQRPAMFQEQGKFSLVDWLIHEHKYYPDGAPNRGPNSRRRKNPVVEEHYLVQVLVDQYNDDHQLFGDLAHELERLVSCEWIYDNDRWFYHLNFTTKTEEASYLFFAEVSHMQGEDIWEVNCCCIIGSDDNGHCYGCTNNGTPGMQHPNDTGLYFGGHLDGYLPFGDDELSSSDEDEKAEEDRLRVMFKGLDDPCVLERIYLLATEPV